uniref:Uncharacterized protein n=1 Tax=Oryza glumipatula TaxID=40148 RepID=A0A0E0B1W9_9ORYZ
MESIDAAYADATSSRRSTPMSPSRLGFCRCNVRACQSCGISFVSISQANCLAE